MVKGSNVDMTQVQLDGKNPPDHTGIFIYFFNTLRNYILDFDTCMHTGRAPLRFMIHCERTSSTSSIPYLRRRVTETSLSLSEPRRFGKYLKKHTNIKR